MPLPIKIILSIAIVEALGFLSGFSTMSSLKTWYVDLQKPPGTPPNWIFGPVWTALYALIGLSFALVWHKAKPGPEKKQALTLFVIQLVLNFAWTPTFFGAQQILAGLVIIVLMAVMIYLTMRAFKKLVPMTFWLLLPYLLWVCYATYLTAGNFILNR